MYWRKNVMNDLISDLHRDLFVLEDENNPSTSKYNIIFPKTVLDQVFDQKTPTKKTLREIIEDLRFEIKTIGIGKIKFPVTSVNGLTGDVKITPAMLNLGRVDNTSDVDKPLSTPQRRSVMDILSKYNFKVNLDDLYKHIENTNNPHNVRLEDIDKDHQLRDYIQRMINTHSLDESKHVHLDIRNNIAKLWAYIDKVFNVDHEKKLEFLNNKLNQHIDDKNAHMDLFKKKEDVVHKVFGINEAEADNKTYPSTRAIVEYFRNQLYEFKKGLQQIDQYISKIVMLDNASELPLPDETQIHKVYIIRNGSSMNSDLVTCILDVDGQYRWKFDNFGTMPKFNPDQFILSQDGISLNLNALGALSQQIDELFKMSLEELMKGTESSGTSFTDAIKALLKRDYLTKDEIYRNFIYDLRIEPGKMDGWIQYYTNNDSTNPKLVQVPGLRRLAFLDYVTEHEIRDLAVENRHLRSRSVDSRVLAVKCVKAEHLDLQINPSHFSSPELTVLGNFHNQDNKVSSIDMPTLAHMLEKYMDPSIQSGMSISFNGDHFRMTSDGVSLNLPYIMASMKDIEDSFKDPNKPIDYDYNKRSVNGAFVPGLSKSESIEGLLSRVDKAIVKDIVEQSSYTFWKYDELKKMYDGSYGIKFKGTISILPNKPHQILLSEAINSKEYELVEIGGRWVTDSQTEAETIIGGSNILGNTQSEFVLDKRGLTLHTISIGNRINAPYDVWIRLFKKS